MRIQICYLTEYFRQLGLENIPFDLNFHLGKVIIGEGFQTGEFFDMVSFSSSWFLKNGEKWRSLHCPTGISSHENLIWNFRQTWNNLIRYDPVLRDSQLYNKVHHMTSIHLIIFDCDMTGLINIDGVQNS